MSDEIQQPTPEPQPEQPVVIPVVEKKKLTRKGILDQLPDAIRAEMDAQIRASTPSAARRYMQGKYSAQFPKIAKLGNITFYDYAKKHDIKPLTNDVKALIYAPAPTKQVEEVIMKVTDPDVSLSDKRAALLGIYKKISDRIDRLAALNLNFTDPQIEQVIINNEKVQIDIIKSMDDLTAQQSKESMSNWLIEANIIMKVFVSAAGNAYRNTETDQTKLSEFIDKFVRQCAEYMKNYKASKEALFKGSL